MDTTVRCYICNCEFQQLSSHITRSHKMTVDEYRLLHPDSNLMAESIRRKKSDNAISPYSIKSWIKKGYTTKEAERLVQQYQLNNSEKNKTASPRTVFYWIKKGYDEETAKILLSNFQDNCSLSKLEHKFGSLEVAKRHYRGKIENIGKTMKLPDNYTSKSSRTVDFWLSLGYNESDAEQLVSSTQRRNLPFFENKYGMTEGVERYKNWVSQIVNTMGAVSTESSVFFGKILENVPALKDEALYGKAELVLKNQLKTYKYDFTIPSKKLIIEYNGIAWHPKTPDAAWKHPFGLFTAKEKFEYDLIKQQFAESLGYRVINVFSDDDCNAAIDNITKELLNGTD